MTAQKTIEDLTSLVDDELRSVVAARDVPLYGMMSYHMGWANSDGTTGAQKARERTRGVLCLLACRAVGGELEAALPAAAALELVHGFTEVHDDVQGGIPQRDEQDAVWWVWGPAQAINTGDGMHALARLALFGLTDRGASPDTLFRAVQLLDEASLEACEGRFLDLEAQERIDLGLEAYLQMATSKSGSLPACAMRLGGLVGAGDGETADALGVCGSRLGVAMQIRADLAELWPEGPAGQTVGPEVMNKKKLMPVVYALERASASEKRRMGEVYFKRVLEQEDVVKLRVIFEELGVKKDCEAMVERYRVEALDALVVAGISDRGRGDIEEFIASLLG